MQRYRPVVHYWPDHNGLSQHAAAMREDSEDGAYYHRADVDAREAQWIAIDRAQKARIAELELSAQQSALERDFAIERVAEMAKALQFYAKVLGQSKSMDMRIIHQDGGKTARNALALSSSHGEQS